MIWLLFILLYVFEANGLAVPQIAWVLAWIFVGVTVLNTIIKILEKRDKNDEKE